jgi:hypothetical protein
MKGRFASTSSLPGELYLLPRKNQDSGIVNGDIVRVFTFETVESWQGSVRRRFMALTSDEVITDQQLKVAKYNPKRDINENDRLTS